MGRIFVVIGKSASGKDRIYKELLKYSSLNLEPLVLYTTRPMRRGEKNGREYYFTDEQHMNRLENEGRIIEKRGYHTVFGMWYYFTANEGQISEDKDYIGIGTLESFVKLKEYFGADRARPVYIECDDRKRLLRAIGRESHQAVPAYKEVCRRYLADDEDFSEENLEKAGIGVRFDNSGELSDCIERIIGYIREQ